MERTHIVKTRLDSLNENLKLAESRKKYFLDYSQKLYTKYVIGDISREFYFNALYEKHDGKNIQEWINYYDAVIQEYKNQLQQQTNNQVKSLLILVSIAFLIVLGLIFFISKSGFNFTGFLVQEEKQTYAEKINLEFTESTTYSWQIKNLGQLLSAKISGIIQGQGNVKIYIEDILILDSSLLDESNSKSYFKSSSETIPGETQNQTSPFQESSPDSEKIIEFSGICEDACNLEQLNLNKTSYILRIEIENAQLKIDKIEYETLNFIEVSEPQINETVSNETIPTIPEENITQSELPTNQTELNQTSITEVNLTETNLTETNFTEPINITNQTETNRTEAITNATVSTTQLPAKVGEPVKWIKKVNPESLGNLTINLPGDADNISVKKSKEKEDRKQISRFSITGAVISNEGETSGGFLTRFFAFLSRIFSGKSGSRLTGFAIEEQTLDEKNKGKEKIKQKKLKLEIDEVTEYEIEYETPAPTEIEQQTVRGKRVVVQGSEEVHYENVLAFTTLDESLKITNPERIRIRWIENNTFISPSLVNDTNQDGIYDYIEWVVPHLSTQTFEIIVITKTEHLDENRNFIEDIYEQVKEQDNVWSSEISSNEYVRITFEQNLTSSKDITIFPRIVSGNPRIEVYEKDETQKIAEFSTINSNQFNQILLTNLGGIQDIFDLKVVGGSLELDYIVDPSGQQLENPSFTGNANNWTLSSMSYNSTVYQDSAGSVHAYARRKATTTGYATQNTYDDYTTGDTVTFSCYYLAAGAGSASTRFYAQIAEDSAPSTWTTIWDTGTLYSYVSWTSSEAVDVSSYFSTGSYRLRLVAVVVGGTASGNFGYGNFDNCSLWRDAADTTYPQFTNYGGTANNTPYTPSGSYVFNTTITDTNGTAWLQFNGANYSATNTSSTFNVTLTSKAAGTYTYRWWAYGNGTSNKINNSGARDYTIAKATTPCNVSFNVSSPVSWGTTFLVWHNCDTTATLYRNGTSITNNTPQNLASGTYNFTVIRTDQTNYSNIFNQTVFVVNKQTLTASLTNDKAWTRNYDGTANAIGYSESNTGDSDVVYKIYRNGADRGSSDSVSSAGTYSYILNSTGGQNYSSSASLDAQTLTINKIASSVNTYINNSRQNLTLPKNSQIYLNVTTATGDSSGVLKLYKNSTLLNQGTSTISNLTLFNEVGYFNITGFYEASENYTASYETFFVTVEYSNTAPTIPLVQTIASQSPIEQTIKPIIFYFTAEDSDGTDNLDDSSAKVYFQKSGETTRYNESCIAGSTSGNQKNYTCTVGMWYFDKAGLWTINVSVKDLDGEYSENSSTTFNYETLTAMKISPTAMNWPENILPTQTDIASNTNPVTINNTGNAENLGIEVTALDLRGLTDPSKFIFANNFTVQSASDGCSGNPMINNTGVTITGAILQRGNYTLNDGTAQEQVFFCLKGLPAGISSQEYSSSAFGSWTIRILLVALAPALKKKKQKKKLNKNNKILCLAIKLTDELKENYSQEKEILVNQLIKSIREEYNISKKEVLRLIRHEQEIPITIFSKELGALESVIKYMKENLNLSYHEISIIIGRDERTVWTAYHKAVEKQKASIAPKPTEITIPVSLFGNKELTVLEFVVTHLKEKGLTLKEISTLLQRDQRNIWLINSRASKKLS